MNIENPLVREEIQKISGFWLEKGVDGFRQDAITHMSKPSDFPDYPGGGNFVIGDMHFNGPKMHEYIRWMNKIFK